MPEVKQCPFCGSLVEIFVSPVANTIMFRCHRCGADVCFFGAERSLPAAVDAWNRRAKDERK